MPFLIFLVVVSAVRGRRATSNVTGFGLVVMLGVIGLVSWARWKQAAPFRTTYPWINVPTSFTGAQAFQGFGIDISIRADHAVLAALAVLTLITLGAVLWHRGAGRSEGGPARLHALLALGLLGACGVAVSGDLAALAAWWGLTGVATYLLLAHRWGTEAAGRASRIGLALPLVGDLSLLCGVALLYSRYGTLDVDRLTYSLLHGTYGAGLKTIGVAAVLIAFGAFVRAGLFPFTGWLTGSLNAPPAAVAWTQGTWSVLAVLLVGRVLPLFVAAGPQPFRLLAYATGGAALVGTLIALVDNDLRRSLTWVGSAVVALLLLGIGQRNALPAAEAGVLAAGLARPVLVMTASSVAAAVRSLDLADMGESRRRMPRTTLAIAAAGVALALAPASKAATQAAGGWGNAWFIGLVLLLTGAAALRPVAVAALLELRRRRAFEPTRVREVVPLLAWTGLGLALLALTAAVLSLVTPWLSFLRGSAQPGAGAALALWVALPLAGAAAAVAVVVMRGRPVLAASGRGQALLAGWLAVAVYAGDRYLRRAGLGVVEGVEGRGLTAGEAWLGRALGGAATGLPELSAGALLAVATVALVMVAVAGALLAPGVAR